jgi:secondary thiamine-phosphate synthase enzyme
VTFVIPTEVEKSLTETEVFTMHVYHDQLEVRNHGRGLYEITDQIESKIDKSRVQNGTVTVFVQHTSCSIVIMENADPTARRDLEEFFDRLVPEGADYFTHDSEGSDDMPSHIRMALTRTSETVPIVDGKMQLGTWQGIFLFEHRRAAHRRKVSVTTIGE